MHQSVVWGIASSLSVLTATWVRFLWLIELVFVWNHETVILRDSLWDWVLVLRGSQPQTTIYKRLDVRHKWILCPLKPHKLFAREGLLQKDSEVPSSVIASNVFKFLQSCTSDDSSGLLSLPNFAMPQISIPQHPTTTCVAVHNSIWSASVYHTTHFIASGLQPLWSWSTSSRHATCVS